MHPPSGPPRALPTDESRPFGILSGGEVSEWLMVPLSKSGVRKHRGFESHPLRHHSPHGSAHPRVGVSAPSLAHPEVHALWCSTPPWAGLAHDRSDHVSARPSGYYSSPSRRGRLVDYGAALEMRFGETRRGFESRPLRQIRPPRDRPWPRWRLWSSLTHLGGRRRLAGRGLAGRNRGRLSGPC